MARPSASLDAAWQKGDDVGSLSPCSQGWWGAGIPPQRPEIHQLLMPNDLHLRSPRTASCVAASLLGHKPWDLTAEMGTGQTPQCHPPGMRDKIGQDVERPSSPISPETAGLSNLLVIMGSGAGPARPWAVGAFPSCLLAANSEEPSAGYTNLGLPLPALWSPGFIGQKPRNRKYMLRHGGHCEPAGILGNGNQARGCTTHHR